MSSQKVTIVTGASQGIGAAVVDAYRKLGYDIVAVSRTIAPSADPDVVTVQGDVADRATAERAVAGTDARVPGPDPQRRSYGSFLSFSDPDGNGWVLQEVTTRLPGRLDPSVTTFASASGLAAALRRAAVAHGEHEARTGAEDPGWPDWYADYLVREQAGSELPA
ncbi:SDR family NAD(P)-dependent oxidoreductase [Nonomuraea sp. NPDC048882]|uniref:SDR family NAD(P)-dependent oxidoreductase n=1 Tax=unclassified Nonomuraea TaxID=2593643 RepID=UPI0033C146FA